MRNKFTFLYLLAIVATINLISCKSTPEGQQKLFERNKSDLMELTVGMKKYAPVIKAHIAELDKEWNDILAISDKEKQLEAMQKFNSSIKFGKMAKFYDVNKAITKLEPNVVFLQSRPEKDLSFNMKKDIEYYSHKFQEIKSQLTSTNEEVGDMDQAILELTTYDKELQSAYQALERHVADLKAADQKAKQASNNANTTTNTNTSTNTNTNQVNTQSQDVAATIKCKYCKTNNKAGSTKCSNCGASL